MVEQRRFSRVPFRATAVFVVKGQKERAEAETRDIALGGMFLETTAPAPFGAEVVVHVHIPGETHAFALPGIVRWVRTDGMGVQFGMIGARETHAISEVMAEYERSISSK